VRPLTEADVPRVAQLHRKVFGSSLAAGDIEAYLREVLCRHPWLDERLPSLVYEEQGRIVGCLGVMPRPMWFEDAPIVAAVTHSFMVEPERRSTLAAMQLVKAFLSGPQDLSLAEGNSVSRRLWEGVGGATSLLHSIRWTHPLRPARYAVSLLERRGLGRPAALALRPLCGAVDLLATHLPQSPLLQRPPATAVTELDPWTLLDGIERLGRGRALRPRYDADSLAWLLAALERSQGRGPLRGAVVRSEGLVLGWYLYYARADGIAEVVQVGASEPSAAAVLDHLFADAFGQGAIAVSGQVEPSLMPAFSERFCLFHRGRDGSWVLVQSRDERILRALQLADALFTRLEGEWWIAA
jgi:hypothetical protein